ncbi:MAG: signal peptidase II [Dehalococcoidales bacterium]|nr:signal peptidase II [Dehalococcoidales bacterium]
MEKAGNPKQLWRNLLILITTLIIIAGDIFTKEWIRSFPPDGETIYQLGFVRIIHIQNTGSAFGAFQGYSLVLSIVAIAGLILLSWFGVYIYRRYPQFVNVPNRIALGLLLGGDLGNLIDRIRFGRVTDFIDVGFIPVFNVADSAITIGVILVIYALLRETIRESK